MPTSKSFRHLRMGLSTVLGIKRQGFFIPYRYAEQINNHQNSSLYQHIEILFENSRNLFLEHISYMSQFSDELRKIGPNQPPQPRWDQSWISPLDAAITYTMVRNLAPKNIIEIGSGHSTRFMARAAADGLLETNIIAIDPAPRANLEGLNISIELTTVQEIDINYFELLMPGDILFIDSSHILMPGTDVDFLINRILPQLPKGVFVHLHDIFLPDDYPKGWHWRGYNEQLGVASLLQGDAFNVLFSSYYVATRMTEVLEDTFLAEINNKPSGNFESSLWLKKISD